VGVTPAVIGICLALEAALPGHWIDSPPAGHDQPAAALFIRSTQFTLSWTHSIEKQRWEEDYNVLATDDDSGRILLIPTAARIKGSGAGMEPPEDSRLIDGWYVYRPTTVPLTALRLTRSFYTDDYTFCTNNQCRSMAALLPSDGKTTLLWGCKKTHS
jgi:hypothetical protein